jgi:hypothetical protein
MSNTHPESEAEEYARMSEVVDLSQLSKFGPAVIEALRSLSAQSHSMLLEGPEASTAAVLDILEPFLRTPVVWTLPRGPFQPPIGECGALVLQEVAALSCEDQVRLVEWLDRSNHRSQLISTSASSLFQRVECGLFDAVLYYRLNVMLLHVEPNGDRRPRRPTAADGVAFEVRLPGDRSRVQDLQSPRSGVMKSSNPIPSRRATRRV